MTKVRNFNDPQKHSEALQEYYTGLLEDNTLTPLSVVCESEMMYEQGKISEEVLAEMLVFAEQKRKSWIWNLKTIFHRPGLMIDADGNPLKKETK